MNKLMDNLHNSIRDLGIGVGGPAGGLLVANIVSDPVMAHISVTLGSLAALTVIIRNVIEIWKNDKK
jgi:predicted MFS family arabinose efflux permease